jgi:hypothetical protein
METRRSSSYLRQLAICPDTDVVQKDLLNITPNIKLCNKEILAPRPTPKVEEHPLSAVPPLFIHYICSYPL